MSKRSFTSGSSATDILLALLLNVAGGILCYYAITLFALPDATKILLTLGVFILLTACCSYVVCRVYLRIRARRESQFSGTVKIDPLPPGRPPLSVFRIKDPDSPVLSWASYGFLLEHVRGQIHAMKGNFRPDLFLGVNGAGVMMAAYLSFHLTHSSVPLGTIYTKDVKNTATASGKATSKEIDTFTAPQVGRRVETVAVCDSRIQTGTTAQTVIDRIRREYGDVRIIYIVLGGSVDQNHADSPTIHSFGSRGMSDDYLPDFVACYGTGNPLFHNPGMTR